MTNFYYNLNGGLNAAKTRIGMGQDTKKLYWADACNVEILKSQGICRQSGNTLLFKLDGKNIVGLYEYPAGTRDLVLVCSNGEIYSYTNTSGECNLIDTFDMVVSAVSFVHFTGGIIIATDTNAPVYFKSGGLLRPLNLKNSDDEPIISLTIGVYASRVWVADGSTLYFSALGTYDDWTTEQDAGYISKFHSSHSEIVALSEYCGSLAVYKPDEVYLLSGSSTEDFKISRFANMGVNSCKATVTAANKQYFINNDGVFYLAQAGLLSQIALSGNIAENVQNYFEQINYTETSKTFALPYVIKNQLWFFIPFSGNTSLNTVLIYDFSLTAWFKRVIPYEITCGATVCGRVYTATSEGEIFVEDYGNTFAEKPIEFKFSSPFFHLGLPSTRKIIEDFNFIFDEERENRFKFSVSKNYITFEQTDVDYIETMQPQTLVWVDGVLNDAFDSKWAGETDEFCFQWAEPSEEAYRTEIFEANTSVQLHIEGNSLGDDFGIVGIEFKEILIDE